MKTPQTLLVALMISATFGVGVPRSAAGGEPSVIVVIVNKANPAVALGASDLRPIFQTSKISWSTGGEATPFNLPVENRLREDFDQAVLGLDPERVARYWQDRKIRGGARAPKQLPSSGAVLAVVAANAGAVAYVGAGEANGSVKVVARIVGGKLRAP